MKYLCGPATVSEETLSRKPLAASREDRQNLRFTSQETCTESEKRMTLTEQHNTAVRVVDTSASLKTGAGFRRSLFCVLPRIIQADDTDI